MSSDGFRSYGTLSQFDYIYCGASHVGATFGNGRFPEKPLLSAIDELQDPGIEKEEVLHVITARVVCANYALIQHDFPELSKASLIGKLPWLAAQPDVVQATEICNIIDRWLTDNTAFVSKSQAGQSLVNTPVATDAITRTAYRPAGYGRAVVIPVFNSSTEDAQLSGLLDVKGAGVSPQSSPRRGDHSDGLDYVGAALSDLAFQCLIEEIFMRAAPACWTVPTYAILDLGFDVVDGWKGTSPAGMHVRRAHRRPHGGMDLPLAGSVEEAVKVQIELLLRHYGLTSACPGTAFDVFFADDQVLLRYGSQPVTDLYPTEMELLEKFRRNGESRIHLEGINLQLARGVGLGPCSAQMVDFGHINVREAFAFPLVSLVRDGMLHIGGIIWPEDSHFIQPDPELQVPIANWKIASLHDYFFGIAEDFRAGRTSSAKVVAALDALIGKTVGGWPH